MLVLTVIAAVLVLVGYWFISIPVPPGFNNPWTFRLVLGLLNLINKYNGFKEYFVDLGEIIIASRKGLKPPKVPEGIRVKVQETLFGEVKVLVMTPDDREPSGGPGVVYFHGGGWCNGSAVHYSSLCQVLAHKTNTVVVSVEYRLAPEHPYPAAIDDCFSATTYFLQHAEEFGVDPNRIAVAGDSAGGNLAAATALRLRDSKVQPQLKLQVLSYAALQAVDVSTPSYQTNKDNGLLSRRKMAMFWLFYATGKHSHLAAITQNKHASSKVRKEMAAGSLKHAIIHQGYSARGYTEPDFNIGDETIWKELEPVFTDPYFAPLMAKDFSNLPETVIFTVEQDVLRDDGIWYAKHLKNAGVEVHHVHYTAGIHGMISSIDQTNCNEFRALVVDAIKSRL